MLESTFFACAAIYAALLTFALVAYRPARGSALLVLVLVLSFAWALATAFKGWGTPGVAQILQLVQTGACVAYLGSLLAREIGNSETRRRLRNGAWVVAACVWVVVVNDLRYAAGAASVADLSLSQTIARVILAVLGLLVIENIYRNTPATRRWQMYPLCIALGALFAYDLFVYSDAMLFRRMNPTFLFARGVVATMVAPLLGLTIVRNRGWRIDLRPSRQVVLHTVTLIASGILLLCAAIVGYILRQTGGSWGTLLQIAILCGAVIVLATVLTSGTLRSRFKQFLVLNFFAHRYDYRVEWMNFIDALSASEDDESLQLRVIRAVGNIVDSPAGMLWSLREGVGYCPTEFWNMHIDRATVELVENPFVAAFLGGAQVQQFPAGSDDSERPATPAWFAECAPIWLAVPLVHKDVLTAFLTLAPPRAPFAVGVESLALLLAVGRQAASYLSEDAATRVLMDAKLLHDYSKRFAFVVHDIKNLVSQLDLTVANARRHGDDPEFRADMMRTLENSVARMKSLLVQLSADRAQQEQAVITDLPAVISSVVKDFASESVSIVTELDVEGMSIAMEPEQFRSSLRHVIANAIEASAPGSTVTVGARTDGAMVSVDVRDDGPGMDRDFVDHELFKPLRSTKSSGYGIGAYQTREQVRAAGGELEVISRSGYGTTMRMLLPALLPKARMPAKARSRSR